MTNRAVDLAVVGAGPAGRALAHRAAIAGLRVALIDPGAENPWKPTYAGWADDLPGWLDQSVISATCESIAVYTPARKLLPRTYVTLGTVALQDSLTLCGVDVHRNTVSALRPGAVTLDDGTDITARAVVDARGLKDRVAPAQSAYGVVVDRTQAAPVLDGDSGILMDWRGNEPDRIPTFLYAIPLDDQRVLLEETCLAAAPAMATGELRHRLAARLAQRDIDLEALETTHTERVHFALHDTSRLPWASTPPVRFGAAGGMVHPATGYSVAESLSSVDRLVGAVAGGTNLTTALWPRRSRAVHRLRLRGLSVLLDLSPADLAAFFDAFFMAPPHAQHAYLSDRHHLGGTLVAMGALVLHGDRRLTGTVIRSAIRPRNQTSA